MDRQAVPTRQLNFLNTQIPIERVNVDNMKVLRRRDIQTTLWSSREKNETAYFDGNLLIADGITVDIKGKSARHEDYGALKATVRSSGRILVYNKDESFGREIEIEKERISVLGGIYGKDRTLRFVAYDYWHNFKLNKIEDVNLLELLQQTNKNKFRFDKLRNWSVEIGAAAATIGSVIGYLYTGNGGWELAIAISGGADGVILWVHSWPRM